MFCIVFLFLPAYPAQVLVSGYGHTCSIQFDNTIFCFGRNDNGQLGCGYSTAFNGESTPKKMIGVVNAKSVCAGEDFTCVIEGSDVMCAGGNHHGQIGNADALLSTQLIVSKTTISHNAQFIACGASTICAILEDMSLRCWGSGIHFQLGSRLNVDQNNATSGHVFFDKIVSKIAIGNGHTCLLGSDQNVYCIGLNTAGQLGNGNTISTTSATASLFLKVPIAGAIALGAGDSHTCALLISNTLLCWGSTIFGQVGAGSANSIPILAPIQPIGIFSAIGVSLGAFHTCAIHSSRSVYCWGSNQHGQLGNETTLGRVSTPIILYTGSVYALATGSSSTCISTSTGEIKCCGWDYYGNLGLGSYSFSEEGLPLSSVVSLPITPHPTTLAPSKIPSLFPSGAPSVSPSHASPSIRPTFSNPSTPPTFQPSTSPFRSNPTHSPTINSSLVHSSVFGSIEFYSGIGGGCLLIVSILLLLGYLCCRKPTKQQSVEQPVPKIEDNSVLEIEEKSESFFDWEKHIDLKTNAVYFFNSKTGESKWDPPTKENSSRFKNK